MIPSSRGCDYSLGGPGLTRPGCRRSRQSAADGQEAVRGLALAACRPQAALTGDPGRPPIGALPGPVHTDHKAGAGRGELASRAPPDWARRENGHQRPAKMSTESGPAHTGFKETLAPPISVQANRSHLVIFSTVCV